MDPEFAAAYAKWHPDMPEPKEPPPGKSVMEVFRESAHGVLAPSLQYHNERLPADSTYSVEDKDITVEGGCIPVRCIIPSSEDATKTFPVLVWYHGGAWVVGELSQDDYFLRSVSVELQICVVNVGYRLGPEHPYPAGLNDAYAAIKWTVDNASSLRVSTEKGLIVGGDSAGAQLATVCAHLARDDPFFQGRPVTGQLLRQPVVVHPEACPDEYKAEYQSMEAFKDGPLLTREALVQSCALAQAPKDDPRFSPLLFPSHAGVAPAFIGYNGMDALRDDSRIWIKVLGEAGVKVKANFYPGVPHGFYYSYPEIALAKKVDRDVRDGLKWLLAGAP
ncbi:Alpha/Beta hydrolase protein [Earliella scabrosa]|nr:Alpha/Beta hydrolase protein [Earliella scabrosa]